MKTTKYKNWTDEQLNFLLENYGKMTTEKISKKISKSIGSIYYILNKENINLEVRWWTKEEIKLLKEFYSSHSNKELEEIFSRSEDAIQLKAATLKLKKDSWWSEPDLDLLREMVFERISYSKMAKTLGRSKSSVHNKLTEQKLTDQCRRWTDKELDKIEGLAKSGKYTYLDIALELNATPGQIYGICNYKGWRDKIKRTVSYGNDKMISLLRNIFPYYTLKPEYHIGEKLRLDAFIKELNIGFEYDGIQHFRYTPQWHRTKAEFERSKERDIRKNELCSLQNITLIRIKYNENLSEELLRKKISIAIESERESPDLETIKKPKSKIQSRPFPKGKSSIPSRGFQKPKDGYKWPKRKLGINY